MKLKFELLYKLTCVNGYFRPISQYNSLTDPYLQGYYSKSIIRNHLKQTGLINRRGEIIPDEIWRKRIATKERMEQASRVIANRIVKQYDLRIRLVIIKSTV